MAQNLPKIGLNRQYLAFCEISAAARIRRCAKLSSAQNGSPESAWRHADNELERAPICRLFLELVRPGWNEIAKSKVVCGRLSRRARNWCKWTHTRALLPSGKGPVEGLWCGIITPNGQSLFSYCGQSYVRKTIRVKDPTITRVQHLGLQDLLKNLEYLYANGASLINI